jgi:hypothetical protein
MSYTVILASNDQTSTSVYKNLTTPREDRPTRYDKLLQKVDDGFKTAKFVVLCGVTLSEADRLCRDKCLYYKITNECCDWCHDPGHSRNLRHTFLFGKSKFFGLWEP